MIGYELKFRGQYFFLPSEAGISVTTRKATDTERTTISVGLYDPVSHNSVVWLGADLEFGDEILVTIKEIKDVTKPAEVFNFYERMNTTKEEADKKAFERFLILEEELRNETPEIFPTE